MVAAAAPEDGPYDSVDTRTDGPNPYSLPDTTTVRATPGPSRSPFPRRKGTHTPRFRSRSAPWSHVTSNSYLMPNSCSIGLIAKYTRNRAEVPHRSQ